MPALVDYQCSFVREMNGGNMDFVLGVDVPVTSLCPYSKAISNYGAHNYNAFAQVTWSRRNETEWHEDANPPT